MEQVYLLLHTTRLASAIPMISLLLAMSSLKSELLSNSEAFDLGFLTLLPFILSNRLIPEAILKSSYIRREEILK